MENVFIQDAHIQMVNSFPKSLSQPKDGFKQYYQGWLMPGVFKEISLNISSRDPRTAWSEPVRDFQKKNFGGPGPVPDFEIFLGPGPVQSQTLKYLLVLVRAGLRFWIFPPFWSGSVPGF